MSGAPLRTITIGRETVGYVFACDGGHRFIAVDPDGEEVGKPVETIAKATDVLLAWRKGEPVGEH